MSGIGDRLKEMARRRGLSLSEVADRAGLPYRSLQNYASNSQRPGADALVKLRGALNVSIDWLLTGEGIPQGSERAALPQFCKSYLEPVEAAFDFDGLNIAFSTVAAMTFAQFANHVEMDRLGEFSERQIEAARAILSIYLWRINHWLASEGRLEDASIAELTWAADMEWRAALQRMAALPRP